MNYTQTKFFGILKNQIEANYLATLAIIFLNTYLVVYLSYHREYNLFKYKVLYV